MTDRLLINNIYLRTAYDEIFARRRRHHACNFDETLLNYRTRGPGIYA